MYNDEFITANTGYNVAISCEISEPFSNFF
ncbi:hypothetical protein V1280_002306 [Bradyrhizobium sp. AZCC 2230]